MQNNDQIEDTILKINNDILLILAEENIGYKVSKIKEFLAFIKKNKYTKYVMFKQHIAYENEMGNINAIEDFTSMFENIDVNKELRGLINVNSNYLDIDVGGNRAYLVPYIFEYTIENKIEIENDKANHCLSGEFSQYIIPNSFYDKNLSILQSHLCCCMKEFIDYNKEVKKKEYKKRNEMFVNFRSMSDRKQVVLNNNFIESSFEETKNGIEKKEAGSRKSRWFEIIVGLIGIIVGLITIATFIYKLF